VRSVVLLNNERQGGSLRRCLNGCLAAAGLGGNGEVPHLAVASELCIQRFCRVVPTA